MGRSGLGAAGAWALDGDSLLALIDGYESNVRWYRASDAGLQLMRTMPLPARSVPSTRSDWNAEWENRQASMRRSIDPAARFVLIEAPPKISVATVGLFGANGSLWVGGQSEGARARWWVFPVSGAPFSVRLPSAHILSCVGRERRYALGTAEDGTPRVFVYSKPRN